MHTALVLLSSITAVLAAAVSPPAELALRNGTDLDLERRGSSGHCFYKDVLVKYDYEIHINSEQDGGLCGGFWANLQTSGACSRTDSDCYVTDGTWKNIWFSVPKFCSPDTVSRAIAAATYDNVWIVCGAH